MNQGDVELRLSSKHIDCDNLRLHRLEATERMSQLYELVLDVVAVGDALDLDALTGAELEVLVTERDQTLRTFGGMVTLVEEGRSLGKRVDRNMHPYRLVVHRSCSWRRWWRPSTSTSTPPCPPSWSRSSPCSI